MTTTAFRKLLLDEYPVSYDAGSLNLYVREGEECADLAITDHASDYGDNEEADTEEVVGIDMRLDDGELLNLAVACIKALKAVGTEDSRTYLADLIKEAVDALA